MTHLGRSKRTEKISIRLAVLLNIVGCSYTLYPLHISIPDNWGLLTSDVTTLIDVHKSHVEYITKFSSDMAFAYDNIFAYKSQYDWFCGIHQLLGVDNAVYRKDRRVLFC